MKLITIDASSLSQSTIVIGADNGEQKNFIDSLSISPFDVVTVDAKSEGGIESVRFFAGQLLLAPQHGARRLGIIYGADYLTHQAQNALLKLLEEPPQSASIILFVATEHGVLPTLYSRCSRYYGSQVVESAKSNYLAESTMDRFSAAEALAKSDDVTTQILAWMSSAYEAWCSEGRPVSGVALLEALWQVYGDSKTTINKRLLLEKLALLTAERGYKA